MIDGDNLTSPPDGVLNVRPSNTASVPRCLPERNDADPANETVIALPLASTASVVTLTWNAGSTDCQVSRLSPSSARPWLSMPSVPDPEPAVHAVAASAIQITFLAMPVSRAYQPRRFIRDPLSRRSSLLKRVDVMAGARKC